MAYKTKAEKRAYKTGLLNGLKRKKKKSAKNNSRSKRAPGRASRHKMVKRRMGQAARKDNNPFGMSYMQLIREEEQRKRDLFGDFDYDNRGRIKGSYTPDGFFEPD